MWPAGKPQGLVTLGPYCPSLPKSQRKKQPENLKTQRLKRTPFKGAVTLDQDKLQHGVACQGRNRVMSIIVYFSPSLSTLLVQLHCKPKGKDLLTQSVDLSPWAKKAGDQN